MSLGHGDLHGLSNEDDSTFLSIRAGGQAGEEGRMIIVQVKLNGFGFEESVSVSYSISINSLWRILV